METNNGFVYIWINHKNKRWYIGSHRGNTDDGYICSSTILKDAMKKHSILNFSREILYEGSRFRSIEGIILEKLDAANDPTSYNLKNQAAGGNGGANKGLKHTPETKAKISKVNKGQCIGDLNPSRRIEVRQKLSYLMTGKTLSDETKDKISIKNSGRHLGKRYEEIYSQEEAIRRKKFMTECNPSKRDDIKKKISDSYKNRKPMACIHCGVSSVNYATITRWHLNNCKHKK